LQAFVPGTKKEIWRTLLFFLIVLVNRSFNQDSTHENR
jgi:hypothetical protein